MKSLLVALMLVAVSLAARADNPMLQAFRTLSGEVQTAMFKVNLDSQTAALQRNINAQFGEVSAPDPAQIEAEYAPVGAAIKKARADGIAAYKAWIIGKTAADQAAAKKLLVAYLTYLGTIQGCPCDNPADQLTESNGQNAFDAAVNEFRVDTGDL